MGLDRSGTWHPECDINRCHADQDPEGVIEVDVPLLGQFESVRLRVCTDHLRQLQPAAAEFCAA